MGQHFTLGAGPAQIMGQHVALAVRLSLPMVTKLYLYLLHIIFGGSCNRREQCNCCTLQERCRCA